MYYLTPNCVLRIRLGPLHYLPLHIHKPVGSGLLKNHRSTDEEADVHWG